jgi:hypothetical protein
MRYLAIWLLCCVSAVAHSQSDKEMKLQAIYNQHAATSAQFGKALTSVAQRACADFHATAAENILADPKRASNTSEE